MVYRHTGLTRVTHAVFFFSFVFLALSGAQIFLHLRWLHFKVAQWHEYAGIVTIACGLVYLAGAFASGKAAKLFFRPSDSAGLWPMIAYYLRWNKKPPDYEEYNPLQKLAYTLVLLLIAPVIAVTGLALWARLGGRALEHVIIAIHLGVAAELLLFFFGHMVMVAMTGAYNNVQAMVTGWYACEGAYARELRRPRAAECSEDSTAAVVASTGAAKFPAVTELAG